MQEKTEAPAFLTSTPFGGEDGTARGLKPA
jgi:hypothetical protein